MAKDTPQEVSKLNIGQSNNNKRVLVVGATSQIGAAMIKYLRKESYTVSGTTRKVGDLAEDLLYFDLSEPTLSNIDFSEFNCVIICAAITNIAQCESDPETCERINATNTIALIDKCVASKCFTIFLSSNAVFDGKKPFYKHTDITSPINKYGEFKVAVEEHIQALPLNKACILRLTKVITDSTPLIKNWKNTAENGNEIKAFNNRLISPIGMEDVFDSIQLLVERKSSGIFHLGSSEEISFYEFAKKIFSSEQDVLNKIVSTQAPSTESSIIHNSLAINLPTKEQQYSELLGVKRITMGLMSGHGYLSDPKRLAFTLARYKFVSKMFADFNKVLEIGCADAFGTPLVSEEVKELVACDFDKLFIDDVNKTHPYRGKITFISHNMVTQPFKEQFDGAYALDVLEHIEKSNEDAFMENICKSLYPNGSCIIGMPSTESQLYASEISKLGHVNCKKGPELKAFLLRHFERVFVFSMNDEVVHTGYTPMAHYLIALCCYPLKI